MRILFMITVGAFVLSITFADSGMPIGPSQYQQRSPPPFILEPVLKINSRNPDNPISWFINMISRAIEPPKRPPPPVIGPINLPSSGAHIYIRQLEDDDIPWGENRLVIKMLTRDPNSVNALPTDSSSSPSSSFHHRQGNPSQRAFNHFGHQSTNNIHSRSKNNFMEPGFRPITPPSQYSPWHSQQRQRPHRYAPSSSQSAYSKPFRPSAHNDFHHDNYAKETSQGYGKGYSDDAWDHRPYGANNHGFNPGQSQPFQPLPMASSYRTIIDQPPNNHQTESTSYYNDQTTSTRITDIQNQRHNFYNGHDEHNSPAITQLPYPEYPVPSDEDFNPPTQTPNVSHVEPTTLRPLGHSVGYLVGQVVRNDRMVASTDEPRNNVHRGTSGDRRGKSLTSNSKTRGFHRGSRYDDKFNSRNVGGMEVIDPPNLRTPWDDSSDVGNLEDDHVSSDSVESESSETNEEEQFESQTEESLVPVTRRTQSKRVSYKLFERSNRSPGSRGRTNNTTAKTTKSTKIPVIENKSEENKSTEDKASGESKRNETTSTTTAQVVRKTLSDLVTKNQRTQGRKPRIVKAIYRRKPVPGIIKTSAESQETSSSNESSTSRESSSAEKS